MKSTFTSILTKFRKYSLSERDKGLQVWAVDAGGEDTNPGAKQQIDLIKSHDKRYTYPKRKHNTQQ